MAIFVQGIDLACRAATLRDRLFSEYRVVSITTGEKLSQNAKIISYAVQRVSPLQLARSFPYKSHWNAFLKSLAGNENLEKLSKKIVDY